MVSVLRPLLATLLCAGLGLGVAGAEAQAQPHAHDATLTCSGCCHGGVAAPDWTLHRAIVAPDPIAAPAPPRVRALSIAWTAPRARVASPDILALAPKTSPPA